MDDKGESEAKPKNKRLELSVAQVAGSALAACVAALLAGKLGVYGTIIGAGVVSVVATTGGTIFQHLFKRTGEKITEATVQAGKPRLRQVPLRDADRAIRSAAGRAGGEARNGRSEGDADATTVMPAVGEGRPGMADPDRTRLLRQAEATQMMPEIDATQALYQAGPSAEAGAYAGAHSGAGFEPHNDQHADTRNGSFHGSVNGAFNDTFSDGTTHGTRLRGWKRPLLAAGAVFVLAMGTVTAVELIQGSSADGGGGTTVGQIFQPQKSEKKHDQEPSHTPGPGHSQGGGQESGTDGSSPSPDPSRQGGGTDHSSPDPRTSPSSGGSTPTPKPTPPNEPSGTPDSGKGDDGKGDTTNGGAGTGGGQPSQSPQPPQAQQNAAAGAGSGS